MGVSGAGLATGNVPARPYAPGAHDRPNVHGAGPGASGGQGLGAPSLGAEGPRFAAPPPPADFVSRLNAWKVPAMRRLADGLWVLAALSPTLALSAAPTLAWLFPGLSWPLVAVGVGLTLLATMALCMAGISRLERHSSGRPPPAQMRAAWPATPPAGPQPQGARRALAGTEAGEQAVRELATSGQGPVPRGYTVLDFRPPQSATDPSPPAVLPVRLDAACRETTRLLADTASPDAEQRGMRLAMTCAAFAKAEVSQAARAPWHPEAWCSPDGMSYNAVFTQERGYYADLLVFTLAEGLGIVTGDLSGRRGPAEWLGGLFGGAAFDRSFGLLGGEVGGVYAAGHLGGRLNGNVNGRRELSRQVRSTRKQDAGPFVGTAALGDDHAEEQRQTRVVGGSIVPAWSIASGILGPIRMFWRRDRKVIAVEAAVLGATADELNAGPAHDAAGSDAAGVPAVPLEEPGAPGPQAPGRGPGRQTRGLHAPQQLTEADSFNVGRDGYFGSLRTANVLLAYLGRHHIDHETCNLSLRCDGRVRVVQQGQPVWLPRLEVTFLQRNQHGARWLGSVAGGVGADTGRRTFTDERQIVHLVARAAIAEPLEALWAAFRASNQPAVRREAWRHFVDMRGVMVRRELSAGTVRNREVGVSNLPVCAGYLRDLFGLNLPSGFGEGFLPWQQGQGELETVFYPPAPLTADPADLVPERLVQAFWRQPSGTVAGPRGTRSRLVAAQLERYSGTGVRLQLLSRWSMSRADAFEVDQYILRPLRQILDEPLPQNVSGMLDASAWRRSAVRHWRTSRLVDLDTTFDAAQLHRLGALQPADWAALRPVRGEAVVASGVALSDAFARNLGALVGAAQPDDPAWLALGQATADFVAAADLAAPGLLRQALALRPSTLDAGTRPPRAPWTVGPMVLRTESDAYNDRTKNYEALAREVLLPASARPRSFVGRVRAEREACRAALLQVRDEPFLEPRDKAAYSDKLRRYGAWYEDVAAAAP